MGNNLYHRTVTIDVSADDDLSDGIHLGDAAVVGIMMPAAWSAANIGFQASVDGTTYGVVVDNAGTPIVVTAPAAGEFVTLDADLLTGAEYIKVSSSALQAADRTISLALKKC